MSIIASEKAQGKPRALPPWPATRPRHEGGIVRVNRNKRFERRVGPMYAAMAALKEYIEARPESPWQDGKAIHYDWPDEMKQLIADYIVAAEQVIPVWESIQARVATGFERQAAPRKRAKAG